MSKHRVRPGSGWKNHKDLPQGPNGRALCRWCGVEVPKGRRSFCSDDCVHEHKLLAHRYERGSVLLTSNLVFSEWERIFKDPMTTAAAIDRLIHHSAILELNLPSYRMEAAKKKKAAKGGDNAAE